MSEFENMTAAPPPPSGEPSAEERQWAFVRAPFFAVRIVHWGHRQLHRPVDHLVDQEGHHGICQRPGQGSAEFQHHLVDHQYRAGAGDRVSPLASAIFITLPLGVLIGIAWLVLTIMAGHQGQQWRSLPLPVHAAPDQVIRPRCGCRKARSIRAFFVSRNAFVGAPHGRELFRFRRSRPGALLPGQVNACGGRPACPVPTAPWRVRGTGPGCRASARRVASGVPWRRPCPAAPG